MKSSQDHLSLGTKPSPPSSSYTTHKTPLRTWFLYTLDWLTVIVLIVVAELVLIPLPDSITFLVTDPSIQQKRLDPNTKDINRICIVINTAVPVVIIVVWLGYFKRPLDEIHHALLGLAMALSFSNLFNSVFKQVANILSADFIDRCGVSDDDFNRSFTTGVALGYKVCLNKDNIKPALHLYPTIVATIPACAMGYLSLFFSLQLGLRIHPHARRQLRAIASDESIGRSRPGQTFISFLVILPVAAGMAFPAVFTRYHGGGHGWGYACSSILGFTFALWAHAMYCCDLTVAVILPPYS